jgi:hypothetical protein
VFIDTVSYSGAGTPTGAVSAGGTSTASNRIAVGPVAAGDMAHFTHYIWASTSNTLTPYT